MVIYNCCGKCQHSFDCEEPCNEWYKENINSHNTKKSFNKILNKPDLKIHIEEFEEKCKKLGVNIKTDDNNLKSWHSIFEELGKKWDELGCTEKLKEMKEEEYKSQ